MLVAKVNSLQRLPHYTFQLTLRYPTEDQRQSTKNTDYCKRNETKQFTRHIFLICYSSDLKKKSGLHSSLITWVTLPVSNSNMAFVIRSS